MLINKMMMNKSNDFFSVCLSALIVVLVSLKVKASECGLLVAEEAWERVVGRQMAGFMMYS